MRLAWSRLARRELTQLRNFSIEHWGATIAANYIDDIRRAAERLALDPRSARPLQGMFRIHRVRSHYLIVYLDETAGQLTVARVLHTAMNIERHLPSDDPRDVQG